MTVPIPSLSLTITPPGGSTVDYTQYLAYNGAFQQMTINQNFGRQGDTAVIPLVDEYTTTPHVMVPVMSRITLRDNHLGLTLFAGVVNDPKLTPSAPNRNEWLLGCTDYTYYADNSRPVYGPYFNGYTADQVVIALTQQANCGITAAPVSAGGFVAPAIQLPSVAINYQSLSSAWRLLARQASQVTPYGWYVDENLQLHFYDSTTAQNSGATFTTSPTVGGSTTEGHIVMDNMFNYEWDGTSVHNLILVQGAAETIHAVSNLAPTDTWRGDGVTSAWPLRYVFAGVQRFTVNGAQTLVTQLHPGEPPNGQSNWYVAQNANGAWFLTATTPPPAGSTIKFWYNYQVPVIAQAQDTQSQALYNGPNGGVFGKYISDQSLSTASMALERAQRERIEFAFAAERVTFTTSPDWVGWVRSGQVFHMNNQFVPDSQNNYSWGLNAAFLATQNRITFTQGGYRTMQLTGIRI
ncbi:hypothetical protein ORV05_05005 [Amycolatopsis cynarae]|uniref:Uncharacterized protein n=1 Tax=Amycolatopsis cynarae TaxID=2995223 RepID=A0ABY7B491_9PSEU|nr:hypothetical protein [Amycolatopsis sp. HUAS 11-8]WAL67151.1 hypothetical protein ORV05_05005 [Amycolatopsis sp. HUAS 11-8]